MWELLNKLRLQLMGAERELARIKAMDADRKLYDVALASIGVDVSPQDIAPDEYGCAESFSRVARRAFPDIGFPIITSTRGIELHMSGSPHWRRAAGVAPMKVILSVTGSGNGSIANGHVGVIGRNLAPDGTYWVMSNDSRSGLWLVNFTVAQWNRFYRDRGGMETQIWERA